MSAQTNKKPESFLGLIMLFVLTMGVGIAAGLTLAVEPFCKEFGVLCEAGFFKIMLIGLSISSAFTVLSGLVIYAMTRFWSKQD